MTQVLKTTIPLAAVLLLATGCGSRDHRLTRMAEQQAALNAEMVKLNRDVVQGMTRLTQENAEFRKEALAIQKQLHGQRTELIKKQEDLDEERRRFAQHDPLVAKAVTHIGITLACLLPLAMCWYLLRQPVDQQLEPAVNELLLQDLVADRPVLISPVTVDGPSRLPFRAERDYEDGNTPAIASQI